MASTYSDLLRLELMANKENRGTWGDKTNNNLDVVLEAAIAGRATVTMTDADYTLTTANASDDEARKAILNIISAVPLTASRNIIVPSSSKIYYITNSTAGGQSITIKTASGSGINLLNGSSKILVCDGVNVTNSVTQVNANTAFIGVSANTTKFPNSSVIVSSTPAANQRSELHNIGILSEGVAHATDSTIYGVGVYGKGYTSPATRCAGVIGEAHVLGVADQGSAIGVRGYSNDIHTGGHNVGLFGEASGASGSGNNYSLYLNNGGIYLNSAQTWLLGANLTFSGSNVIYNNTNIYTTGISSILVGGSGGIGYGPGSGGTITQLTSKATTVVLNKTSGQITTNNAVLAGNTTVSFTMTNSTLKAGDVLVLNHLSGGTAGSYLLNAQCAAGSASINIRNITNASLTEAITIAFATIKTATA
jgi:hypothetical protein